MVLTSARPSDGAAVYVTIRRLGVLQFGDRQYSRVFNILMRHCLQDLQLQQVSDNVNKNFNLALNTLKTKDRLVSSHHSCSFACVMRVRVRMHVHSYLSLSIIIYFFSLYNNQLDTLIYQVYFGMKFYMFRTVTLCIIRSYSLYAQQWYVSYKFVDSF
jgi:hypothetical protein